MSRFREQPLGGARVVRQRRDRRVVGVDLGDQMMLADIAQTINSQRQHLLAIDREAHRLAHAGVVERFSLRPHADCAGIGRLAS